MEAGHSYADDCNLTTGKVLPESHLERDLDHVASSLHKCWSRKEAYTLRKRGTAPAFTALVKAPCTTCMLGEVHLQITPKFVCLSCRGVCTNEGRGFNKFPSRGDADFSVYFEGIQRALIGRLPPWPLDHCALDDFVGDTDLLMLMQCDALMQSTAANKELLKKLTEWHQGAVNKLVNNETLASRFSSPLNAFNNKLQVLRKIFLFDSVLALFVECNNVFRHWTGRPFVVSSARQASLKSLIQDMIHQLMASRVVLITGSVALIPSEAQDDTRRQSVPLKQLLRHLALPVPGANQIAATLKPVLMKAVNTTTCPALSRELLGFHDGVLNLNTLSRIPWTAWSVVRSNAMEDEDGVDRDIVADTPPVSSTPSMFFNESLPLDYLQEAEKWHVRCSVTGNSLVFECATSLGGTPALDHILECQGIRGTNYLLVLALLGSLFHSPKHDRFEICIIFEGRGGTGKSSVNNVVVSLFEENGRSEHYTVMDKFSTSAFVDKYLAFNTETHKCNLVLETFKKLVSSESSSCRSMYAVQQTLAPELRLLLSGNGPFRIPTGSDYSSILRRLFVVPFHTHIPSKDTGLEAKLRAERMNIVIKCAVLYRALCKGIGSAKICDVLPDFYKNSAAQYLRDAGLTEPDQALVMDEETTAPSPMKKRVVNPAVDVLQDEENDFGMSKRARTAPSILE